MVLSGCGIKKDGDGSYNLYDYKIRPEKARLVDCIVRKLYAEAKTYYESHIERPANYEDLYYLAKQALDEESGEMENPAVRSFAKKLKADMLPLLEELLKDEADYWDLLDKTCKYIFYMVHQNLLKPPPKQEQLEVIARTCLTTKVTSISTLCHDTHVETFLKDADIKISDGFSEPQDKVRYWNGDFYARVKTPFLKLHGSVDWFRFQLEDGDFYDEKIGITLKDYPGRVMLKNRILRAMLPEPLLLIGTFNKITEYSSGIFRELHYHFRSTIKKAGQLVVCGYSFGDKGINSEIIEWLYGDRKRRLVIIDPADPDSLRINARGAIQKHWDEWKINGALIIIKKPFENVEIEDFMGVSRGN